MVGGCSLEVLQQKYFARDQSFLDSSAPYKNLLAGCQAHLTGIPLAAVWYITTRFWCMRANEMKYLHQMASRRVNGVGGCGAASLVLALESSYLLAEDHASV